MLILLVGEHGHVIVLMKRCQWKSAIWVRNTLTYMCESLNSFGARYMPLSVRHTMHDKDIMNAAKFSRRLYLINKYLIMIEQHRK